MQAYDNFSHLASFAKITSPTMNPIRILLVDDHYVTRCGIRLMLSSASDIEVVGEAASVSQAMQELEACEPDVVLLDLSLPDGSGLDFLKHLRARYPKIQVLVMSMQAEHIYAVRSLKQGAAGFLSKDSGVQALVGAVRKAAAGGKYVTPAVLQQLAGMVGSDAAAAAHERLTDRELEVLKRIAAGDSLVVIGERLHLSPSTVTTYRARILDKLGLKGNAELVRYALDHGLLD